MSSSNSLRLELRTSRWLQCALCCLALTAALGVWRASVPTWVFGLVPVLLALSLLALHRQPRGLLVLQADGRALWTAHTSAEVRIQQSVEAVLVEMEALQLRGPLTVLAFRVSDRRRDWCAAPDTLSNVERRRLRLWMQTHHANPGFSSTR